MEVAVAQDHFVASFVVAPPVFLELFQASPEFPVAATGAKRAFVTSECQWIS